MRRFLVFLCTVALATMGVVGAPAASAAALSKGTWTGAQSISSCGAPVLFAVTCRHEASMAGFTPNAPSLCVEVLALNVGLTNCSASLYGAFTATAPTQGLRLGAFCATVGTVGTGRVLIISQLGSFEVPVQIANWNGSSSLVGTFTTPLYTIAVNGHFNNGCGAVPTGSAAAGIWSGTFTISG